MLLAMTGRAQRRENAKKGAVLSQKYILALDQGTTGSRAFLFDAAGKITASAYQEFPQYFPKPGWVEHNADEIWDSCRRVIEKTLKISKVDPQKIQAIGITNQRETTVLWDKKTSRPIYPAIVWQCRRTADICERLKKQGLENLFKKKTGLVLDAYFSGTKIQWLLDNVKGLRQKAQKDEILFGTIDSWLLWKLTGGASHATDLTNASRTLTFNIRSLKWDAELLKILKIPQSMLPEVKPSGSHFGTTVKIAGLPSGIPITAMMGDQQSALYGQGCFTAGTIKNTYGTGCFLVLNTGKKLIASRHGLLSTIACDERGQPNYALEGSIFIGGAVIQWLRDQLNFFKSSRDCEKMIDGLTDTQGVYFVPAFTGLGAPYWDSEARGQIIGLTRGSNKRHIVLAALESIAYQTRDVFDLMERESGQSIKNLKVDGGASANNFLMQFQADCLNCSVERPKAVESTAVGAAHLAGITLGIWTPAHLKKFRIQDKIFQPRVTPQKRKQLYDGWLKAVARTKSK